VQSYVRREYGIAIGERTAEDVKLAIGSAFPVADDYKAEVRGRDLMSGLPKTVILEPVEIREGIKEPVDTIVDAVKTCLAQAPPELAQDLITEGIHLVGGGALLKGLDHRLAAETDLPMVVDDHPLEVVVLGAGRCLESFERLQGIFLGSSG